MATMFCRAALATACAWLAGAAAASVPPRYVPAPPGKTYYMLAANGSAFGTYTSSESALLPSRPDGQHKMESSWSGTSSEIGILAGHGLGSLWFLKSMDASIYVPGYFRSFKMKSYLVKDDPEANQTAYARATLHPELLNAEAGKGIGDPTLSLLALWYADPPGGTWIGDALRITVPLAASSHESFIKLLHGIHGTPAGGDGVARLTPTISGIQMIAGQRLYADVEYGLPLGTESFSFTTPKDARWDPNTPFADANTFYKEDVKPGAVLFGTLGLETTLNVAGVTPAVEVNFRNFAAASWTENGKPGDAQPLATTPYPVMTPEFIRTGAWVGGNLPLKSNTEVEIGLVGTARMTGNDLLRVGVSYVSGGFGSSINFKVAFLSLFIEKPQSDTAVPGHTEAREIEVAPLLDAPLAATGRIVTGVTFPALGAGVSQEEASWAADRLREDVKKLRDYDLFPAKDMAQLAFDPCGDADCGTRFGRALRLQAVVVSRLEKTAVGYSLGVSFVNVADGTVAASDSVSAASLDALKPEIPVLLKRITAPPPRPGEAGTPPPAPK